MQGKPYPLLSLYPTKEESMLISVIESFSSIFAEGMPGCI
jgi:hypothetical protein